MISKYKYIKDNNIVAVHPSTGELLDTITVDVPVGSIIYTPEQQKEYKQRKEKERQRQLKRSQLNELGYFFFVLLTHAFDDLSPETTARLIYLSTYLNYQNRLMITQKTPMKKSDLEDILRLSRSSTHRFWREISPKYIVEDEIGLHFPESKLITRGKMPKENKNNYYHRCYLEGVRNLYQKTPISNHKHLGYVFKLMPYINVEYNIVCTNPFETDIKLVEPLTLEDFCKKISYDTSKIDRLRKIYGTIIFDVCDHKEQFCSFVYNNNKKSGLKMFVNPHILYSGTNYKNVEVLGAFCK